ncbi:MAG: Autotransporter adhesin EhaG [Stenotrophomonas maltophilia]|uniref:Autotransporter adhesin EhaG n=1 Tax=Stenotrophomonas maltophilia TaxID=40324 RepID=A0A7V8FFP0_STEMA|nr:MAG: Autotransporter adhesin EhaG [Stenotrophomonas maltophilia]
MGSGSRNATGAGISRIAIGGNSYAGSPGWTGAIALGGETEANFDAVAIGYQAKARASNSVALGRGSQATQSNTVSVGSSSIKRRIVNVADGNVALNSNDAVNGGQLQSVKDGLGADIGGVRSTADSALRVANSASTTANTARTTANTALSRANELNGLISQASVSGTVRLGGENTGTVLDVRNKGNANRKISGVADGTLTATSTEAVNGKQLLATNATVTTAQNTANTAQNTATAARTTADSALSRANVLGGLVSKVAANGNVRLGGENTGTLLDVRNKSNANRKISGVADGTLSSTSTEAVNGRQLQAVINAGKATGNAMATGAPISDANKAIATGTVSLAIGNLAKATANATTAVGHNSRAEALNAVAMGVAARASGEFSAALGSNSVASHKNSAALGENSATNGVDQVSVGNSSLKRKIVNVADGALNDSSSDVVTGRQLNSTNDRVSANQRDAASAKASADQALADTRGLKGLIAQAGTSGNLRLGAEYSGTTLDVRSKDDANRKVSGVANGAVSASSSDAINGSQLQAVINTAKINSNAIATGATITDVNKVVATGNVSLAMGNLAKATANAATAVGHNSKAEALNSVSIGAAARASAEYSAALGSNAIASHRNSVALGENSATTGVDQVSVGNDGLKRKIVNVADGALSDTSHEVVTGRQLNRTNADVAAVRGAADAAQSSANQALEDTWNLKGLIGQTSASGNLRLGGENTGALIDVANKNGDKRRMINLADGVVSSGSADAITGNQLFATNDAVRVQGETLASYGLQLADHDGRIAGNLDELQRLRVEFDYFDPDLDGVVKFDASGNVNVAGGKLTGVAAGDISSAASTDAVNGGQIYATNSRVDELERGGKFLAVGDGGDQGAAAAGRFSVALGDSALASPGGESAVAIGAYAVACGTNSVAIGRAASIENSAENSFALGTQALVGASNAMAIGSRSRVDVGAAGSIALGSNSIANEPDTVSFDHASLQRRLLNVSRGRMPGDAAVVSQLEDSLAVLGGGAGMDANGDVIAPTYNIQGATQNTVGDALSVLDSAVVSANGRADRVESQLRSVFQDTPSLRNDGLNQLTFAGVNGMVLSNVANVANGAIAAGSRDAVNGGQLHSMQQQLNGRMDGLEQRVDGQPQTRAMTVASADAGTPSITTPAPPAETPRSTPPPLAKDDNPIADAGNAPKSSPQPQADAPKPEAPTPQVDTAELEKMLARANEYSDGISREVDLRLDKMDKRLNRMAAMSSAQSAMAMNTAGLNTYNRLGAGVGYSEGESAMAVGYQRLLNDKGSATFSLNGAFTNSGERSMGVGVGIGW